MRIGLLGGSFDPPHRGHLVIAGAAADAFALDQVWFAPAGVQPLKRDVQAASYADRCEMVEIACANDPRFRLSRIDAPRADGRPNYTLWTLERFAAEEPHASRFNLAGADSFLSIGQWHEPRRLLELAEWIVVSRPGFRLVDPCGELLSPDHLPLTEQERRRIHLLNSVEEVVSATVLRDRLGVGDPCYDLLASGVADYIRSRALYRHRP